MSTPSQWPLRLDAIRSILPEFMIRELRHNALSRDCYPLAMGYYPHASGHSMTRKTHDDNLLIYCTEGSGEVTVNNRLWKVEKGELLLLPAGTAHHYRTSRRTPWTIYWLHFDGILSPTLIENLNIHPEQLVLPVGIQAQLISDFKRLLSVRHNGYRLQAYLNAAAIIRQILCYLPLLNNGQPTYKSDSFDIEAIKDFMLQRLQEDLTLETLAGAFNLSKYHFSSKYKKLTGQSPIKHFIHLKMEHACYLLDASPQPVSQISAQLGYADPLYFSRIFRKTIGLSPSNYRLQQRG